MTARESDEKNCRRCLHFAVTWEKRFPYACKAMGFKTRVLPSIEVFRSSGLQCLMFEARPSVRRRKGT